MTDKITFYLNDTNNTDGIPSGSVVISENNLEVQNLKSANLYANVNGKNYKIGPDYKTEIENLILTNDKIKSAIGTQIFNIIGDLGLLSVIKVQDEDDTKLNFSIANDFPQIITNNEGVSLTTTQLQDGVENGTFKAGNKTIKIGGLKSMAYEDAEDYVFEDGIDEGTFKVGNKAIKIGGLQSMAYEKAEDYISAAYYNLNHQSGEEKEGEG